MKLLVILFVALLVFGCNGEKVKDETPALPGGSPPSATPAPSPAPTPTPQPTSVPSSTQKTISKISLGSYFGQCAGYCITSLQITKDNVFYKKIGIPDPEARQLIPELNATIALSESEWNELILLIDIDKLENLPDTIGCPDCVDQGAQTLEVAYNSKKKSVSFSYMDKPKELVDLLTKLTEIREKMEAKLGEGTEGIIKTSE
ncbi:hypothetical protein J4450_01500 [Candidatus Micrarchaeota archaeon]|nr:hypothetical protein [Candidatus Micrarchaeota archaeon]